MLNIEHPEITTALRTGCGRGEPQWPRCPVCGAECEDIYKNLAGDIFACDKCLETRTAWEVQECFPERE